MYLSLAVAMLPTRPLHITVVQVVQVYRLHQGGFAAWRNCIVVVWYVWDTRVIYVLPHQSLRRDDIPRNVIDITSIVL